MIELAPLCGQICLGKQGENLARMVCFDELAEWKKVFGEGRCELFHQRNGDSAPYPVVVEVQDNKVCWKITASDTAIAGEGKCELHYIVDDVIVKSKIWNTTVTESLGEGKEEAPEPQKAWVDQVLTAAEEVKSATTHQPVIGENGNWFIWDADSGEYKDSGTSAEGIDGKDGTDGKDGYTPKKGVDYYTAEETNELVKEISNTVTGDIETALDAIIGIQNSLIEGDGA